MRATRGLLLATAIISAFAPHDVASAGDAPRAIDAIENDLVADDPAVRAKAAAELTDRFPDGAVAVPMLVDLLDDESPDVVAAAAKAIDSMAVAGTGPLVAFLSVERNWRRDGWVTGMLTTECRWGGQPLLNVLDRKRRARGEPPTADELAVAGLFPQLDLAPWLIDAARNSSDGTRALAAAALAMQGADVLVYEKKLPPTSRADRSKAAAGATAMVRSNEDLKAWAGAMALSRVRSSDDTVVDALSAAIASPAPAQASNNSGEPTVMTPDWACRALGAIGAGAVRAAPTLLGGIANEAGPPSVTMRVSALLDLGRESDVLAVLKSDPPTSRDIVRALAWRGRAPAVVVPRLIAEVRTSKGFGSWLAVNALMESGAAAAEALPLLKQRVSEEKDQLMRLRFAEAILAIAPADADALKFLESAPEESGAMAILARRAAPTPSVVKRLVEFVAREVSDDVLDPGVVDAIARCGALAKAAVADLVVLLKSAEDEYVDIEKRPSVVRRRRSLVVALGRIGPDAAAAIPALTALRDKGDETIRVPAAQALRRIRAKK